MTPEGVVLPISARMLKEIDTYAGLLKAYSAPRTALINYALDADSDTILIKSPQPYWLYASFDATALCEFVFRCIEQCVEQDLAQEIQYLRPVRLIPRATPPADTRRTAARGHPGWRKARPDRRDRD